MKSNILRIILFLIIIIVPPLSWELIRNCNEDLYEDLQIDLGEKRDLTTIESGTDLLVNGSILTDYYADRAPFRNVVISANRKFDNLIEKPYDKLILPAVMKLYDSPSDQKKHEVVDEPVKEDAFNDLFGPDPEPVEEPEPEPEPVVDTHNYVEETLEPATCYKTGIKKVYCTDCDYENIEEIPKLTHEYEPYNVVEASYDDYGCDEYMCKYCYKIKRDNFTDKLIDDSYLAPTVKQNEVIIGRSDWLFLAGDGNSKYYTRENVLDADEMDEYVNVLSRLNELCIANGKRLAVIVAPNKDQVYSEYMPTYTFVNSERRTEKLVKYIKENTDVQISYTIDELKYAKRYWQLYYKYDSHWNSMGAFIGEQALLKLLGYEVTNPENINLWWYEKNNDGDLISLGALEFSDYPKDSDYVVEYKPDVNTVSLIEGNWDVMTYYKTAADISDGEKCVFIGDSYRINMIPYVSKEFSECSFVYRDNLFEAEADFAETDVIVIEAVERKDYTILDTAKWLIEYFNNQNK